METHPPEPLLVHRLPPAPHFVGRQPELEALHALWKSGYRGVVGLVGLGGAGKTAIAAHFLDDLLRPGRGSLPCGLLVWSFYQEPDAGLCLQTVHQYFGAPAATLAKGMGLLHLLRDALTAGGPHLLVLDGLERVQRQEGDAEARHGQIEDPLLKRLLVWLAEGTGQTMVLITSRFPLTDLEGYRGGGYRTVEVGGLSVQAAVALLRARGVWGEDAALVRLVENYGAHALTLDHLGGLIGQFLDGDPSRAPEAPALASPGVDRQAFRLARLLRSYEEHLPPAELALLCRLCLLRRSVTAEQMVALFLCTPGVHARTVRELPRLIRHAIGPEAFSEHTLDQLARTVQTTVEEALCAATLAGPEEHFLQEIISGARAFVELEDSALEVRIADLAELYKECPLDVPTDQRPLPASDRARFRRQCERYVRLRGRLGTKADAPKNRLEQVFLALGYGEKSSQTYPEDVHPSELPHALRRVRQQLRQLAYKHVALQNVRELCKALQRKWTLAGPLAALDRGELLQVLDNLVSRHLVVRESDGTFSVHPAVRDHFGRLGSSTDREAWHDFLRDKMLSLVQQPGRQLPHKPATLDLVEETIYHALQAGRTREAAQLFERALGGLRHLGWKLGEMARGVRILRSFPECPDRWALGWFLRALGEYEEALALNPLPCFRADIRLLQGRLPHVAVEGDETRAAIAAFLMGRTKEFPPDRLGCAIPTAQLLLLQGRLHRLNASGFRVDLYQDIGWEGERARCQLLLAEAARRHGDLAAAGASLQAAYSWAVHSGSIEHLCLLHLVQARLARSEGDGENAQRAVAGGIHMARQCGLGLYLIELLCEQAEICLARADAPAAEHVAAAALERAQSPDCQFQWGAAEAGHLLGQALWQQGQLDRARRFLKRALARRRILGDPRVELTRHLLDLVKK
jgi:tetratricopeptide (TPR) repeat protein